MQYTQHLTIKNDNIYSAQNITKKKGYSLYRKTSVYGVKYTVRKFNCYDAIALCRVFKRATIEQNERIALFTFSNTRAICSF